MARAEVIGYLRVSTEEQADSGLGLEAQRAVIEAEASRRGWSLRFVEDAGYSAKTLTRPGIQGALRDLASSAASALVVSKLDRLSRSVLDFASVVARAQRQGWGVVALDVGLDTTSIHGRLITTIVMAIAEWEREMIGKRTREALRAKRRQGFRLGRPRAIPEPVERLVRSLAEEGRSLEEICQELHNCGLNPPGGGSWARSTIRAVLRRARETPT